MLVLEMSCLCWVNIGNVCRPSSHVNVESPMTCS
jgi:hypothetical protein